MTHKNRLIVGFFASFSRRSPHLSFSCNNHVLSSLDQFVQEFKILNFFQPASFFFFSSVVFEAAALVHFLGKKIRLDYNFFALSHLGHVVERPKG